jgi:hypothetical protein
LCFFQIFRAQMPASSRPIAPDVRVPTMSSFLPVGVTCVAGVRQPARRVS